MPSPLRVAYLGPSASFSHQAALEAFPDTTNVTLHPLPSFQSIFSAIQHSSLSNSTGWNPISSAAYDYALIPIENSTNGGVVAVLDLLTQCGLHPASCLYPDIEVVAEHYLEVHHCLLVHPDILKTATDGSSTLTDGALLDSLNITTLYTHPQVWGQCARYLSKYFPASKTERIDMSSTSAAAVFVAHDSIRSNPHSYNNTNNSMSDSSKPSSTTTPGNIAAISSSLAQESNNLTCLASNIEDEPGQNTTRFLIMRHRSRNQFPLPPSLQIPQSLPSSDLDIVHKSLIIFTLPHKQPGALAKALAIFASHDFNLTAITTRPSRERNWHYVFFVRCEEKRALTEKDMERHEEGGRVQVMLEDLKGVAERTCLLGSWVAETRYPG